MMILKLGDKDTTLGKVDKQEVSLILNKNWYPKRIDKRTIKVCSKKM